MGRTGGQTKYWFRARRYGYGWGLPTRWQGWAVLLGYGVLLTAAVCAPAFLGPTAGPLTAVLGFLTASIALEVILCYTGEPPEKP
jgi:hypothetical protein